MNVSINKPVSHKGAMRSILSPRDLRSSAGWLACASSDVQNEFLDGLGEGALCALPFLFEFWAMAHQLPPAGAWRSWVILGGRMGFVLFYATDWIWTDPLRALRIWDGGMSFHGGLIGVAIAMAWLAHSRKLPILRIADGTTAVVPIGLFFGRIANFINGELYGRPWDGPWAMTFPCDRLGVPVPRHPSQLYEAALEGITLFLILLVATRVFKTLRRPGLTTGVFLIGYGIFRSTVEQFRMPDIGFENLPFGLTMGQYLSTPMWLGGAALVFWALSRAPIGAPKTA